MYRNPISEPIHGHGLHVRK